MQSWRTSVTILLCAALLGCAPRIPFLMPNPAPQSPSAGAEASLTDETLRGAVDLSVLGYHVQATMGEIGNGATVSLIDTSTNQTVSTTLSSSSGQFSMQLSGDFKPVTGRTYFLEAIKGLSGNSPSNPAARVRTVLLRQSGGWSSLTNAAVGGSITINTSTTALSAILGLRSGTATPVSATALIGKLNLGAPDSSLSPTTPDTFTPVSHCSNQDFHSTWGIVSQALSADRDPMHAISLDLGTNTFFLNTQGGAHTITSLSPSTGAIGTAVAIGGSNFDPNLAGNVVLFGNQATASAAGTSTLSRLDVTVPPGALTGQVTVRRGNTISLGPNFVVVPTLSGFAPASATASTNVVLTGTGFDPTAANNTVQFNGTSAVVSAASPTSLTVLVPAAATKGRITVATSGGTATSATNFTVLPWLSALSAPEAATGSVLTLTGTGFTTTGSVSFNGANASVSAWSNTSITVTVPNNATNGPVSVTTAAGTSNTKPFSLSWPWRDGGKSCWDPSGNFYFVVGTDKLYKVPAGSTTPQIIATVPPNPYAPDLTSVVYGPDGNLWIANYSCYDIGKFNLTTNTYSVVVSPDDPPLGLAWSPDKRTLFIAGAKMYMYDLDYNTLTGPLPSSPSTNRSVVCDSLGNAYFTSGSTSKIYKIAAGTTTITELVSLGVVLMGLGIDPSNNLYYQSNGTITKFNIATPGTRTTVATGLDYNGYHNLLYHEADGMLYSLLATLQITMVDPSSGNKTPWLTVPAKAWF